MCWASASTIAEGLVWPRMMPMPNSGRRPNPSASVRHPHSRSQGAFRQDRNGKAGQYCRCQDCGRPTGEENAVVVMHGIQYVDSRCAPDAGGAADCQRKYLFFMHIMMGRGDPQQLLAAHDFRTPMLIALGYQSDVKLALADHLVEIDRGLADNRKFDARVGARKSCHDLRQEPVGVIVGGTDTDMALQLRIIKSCDGFIVEL